MATAAAITVRGLTKEFNLGWKGLKVRAVDGLDLEVPTGTVFGLLGPNGSGKSTTIKTMLGLLRPTRGEVRVFGEEPGSLRARQQVGFLPESPYLYRFLTGVELVRFFGRLSGLEGRKLEERAEAALERVGLGDAAERRLSTYSKGMLQRVGLAQAIVNDPRLVILDEPTAGVDPIGAEAMAGVIQDLKREGKTVLLCSHHLGQAEALCDAVAILHRGRCLLQGRLEDLLEQRGLTELTVKGFDGERRPAVAEALQGCGLELVAEAPRYFRLEQLFLETVAGVTAGGEAGAGVKIGGEAGARAAGGGAAGRGRGQEGGGS